MAIVKLSKQKKRVELDSFELESEVVYSYFSNLPAKERDIKLQKAIYIGVLALMEDRLSTFLSNTSNELGTELESLKMLFDMKQELFQKSSVKGVDAEGQIAEYLIESFKEKGVDDEVVLTGDTSGVIPRNKTGDIVCYVEGQDDQRIVVECKFDKSVRMGNINTKDIFTNKVDTAWSQLIEAGANRDGKSSIIVFDLSSADASILKEVPGVRYIPSVGFAVVVDSQRGDYSNLQIAYFLSRDIVVNAKSMSFDKDIFKLIIERIVKDTMDAMSVKSLVVSNIENSRKILAQLEKSHLLMKFNQRILIDFLKDGTMSKEKLLEFYFSDDVKQDFKVFEKELKSL